MVPALALKVVAGGDIGAAGAKPAAYVLSRELSTEVRRAAVRAPVPFERCSAVSCERRLCS
jgi:hypothetical protein